MRAEHTEGQLKAGRGDGGDERAVHVSACFFFGLEPTSGSRFRPWRLDERFPLLVSTSLYASASICSKKPYLQSPASRYAVVAFPHHPPERATVVPSMRVESRLLMQINVNGRVAMMMAHPMAAIPRCL
jgi:hypothetical protein